MSNRRQFLKKASIAGIVAGLTPQWVNARQVDQSMRSNKDRVIRVAHITDVHVLNQANAETCFARVLREINNMKDKPDFIINTGDTVMDENKQTLETVEMRWNVWNQIAKKENSLLLRSALGNHDVWYGPTEELDEKYKGDRRYGKQWAMDVLSLPSRYYSFELKGWKFVCLDSINGESGYQLDEEQFVWLEKELTANKDKKPVCIYSHVPILSMGALLYATKRAPVQDVKFPSGDMHNDHQRIKDLFFKAGNVKLCLSGHVHYVDGIEYLGVRYLCNGAVSGNWWRDPVALDEFPPVYSIIDLYADGTSDYRLVYYDHKI